MMGRVRQLRLTAPGEVIAAADGKPKRVGQVDTVDGTLHAPGQRDIDRGTAIGKRIEAVARVPLTYDWKKGGKGYTVEDEDGEFPLNGSFGVVEIRRGRSFYRVLLSRGA